MPLFHAVVGAVVAVVLAFAYMGTGDATARLTLQRVFGVGGSPAHHAPAPPAPSPPRLSGALESAVNVLHGTLGLALAGSAAHFAHRLFNRALQQVRRALFTTYTVPNGSPMYYAALRFLRAQEDSKHHSDRTVVVVRAGDDDAPSASRPYAAAPALRRGVLTTHNGIALWVHRPNGASLSGTDDMAMTTPGDDHHPHKAPSAPWYLQLLGWLFAGGDDFAAPPPFAAASFVHPLAHVGPPSGSTSADSAGASHGSAPLVLSVFARPARADATVESLLALGNAMSRSDARTFTQVYAPFSASSGRMGLAEPLPEWRDAGRRPSRPLKSVILSDDALSRRILNDASAFLAGAKWYAERGIPWRRGYLFFGPPGTGKTSLAFALAGELRLALYTVRLGSLASDDALHHLMRTTAPRSIVLMEDVDAALPHVLTFEPATSENGGAADLPRKPAARGGSPGVTLAGVLEALDGAVSQESRITILTTNHPEKLRPALVRPGRVDLKVKLGFASADMARRLFLRFFRDAPEHAPARSLEEAARAFAACVPDEAFSIAQLQSLLMSHRGDPAEAVAAARRGALRADAL